MTTLMIADSVVDIHLAPSAPPSLRGFLARIADPPPAHTAVTHLMEIHGGRRAALRVSTRNRSVRLDLPPTATVRGGHATIEIAVLQAVARSLATMRSEGLVLLHGGAVTLDGGRSAVAVLDGGRGQGKTSLAMGLARHGGQLLVDEFAFTDLRGWPSVVPMPTWPWHVRRDMAPILAPRAPAPLLYREDLGSLAFRGHHAVPLRLILIPDHAVPAGQLAPVSTQAKRSLLRAAITDHGRKLRDPVLDHVSIFTSADEISIDDHPPTSSPDNEAFEVLADIPTLRAGIGAPHDLPSTVAAAMDLLVEAG